MVEMQHCSFIKDMNWKNIIIKIKDSKITSKIEEEIVIEKLLRRVHKKIQIIGTTSYLIL